MLAMLLLHATVSFCGTRELNLGVPDTVIQERAAGEGSVRWKIPLGPALVEDMIMVAPGRMLVGLRKDFTELSNMDYLLVDIRTGDVIWRFDRKKEKGRFTPILLTETSFSFRVSEEKKVKLITLDAVSGTKKLSIEFKDKDTRLLPIVNNSQVLAVQTKEKTTHLSAINIVDGSVAWEREITSELTFEGSGGFVLQVDYLWQYRNGLEKISLDDGKTVWDREDLMVSPDVKPQFDGGELFFVNDFHQLICLEEGTGEELRALDLPEDVVISDIYPTEDRIYVRGISPVSLGSSKDEAYRLVSIERSGPSHLWQFSDEEANISNIIVRDGRLYFATPTSVVCLNAENGREIFTSVATNMGWFFPVRIRSYPDRIVFIGELMIAAFDPVTGRQLFSHGMSPVSNEADLASLDAAIPRIKADLESLAGYKPDFGASFAHAQYKNYQNLTRYHEQQARHADFMNNKFGRDRHEFMRDYYKDRQRTQAFCDLTLTVAETVAAFVHNARKKGVEATVERQELLRKSILSQYSQAEWGDWIYRPNKKWASASDDFVGVSIVHLPTGKHHYSYLSPTYLSYGLWNYIDLEEGLIIHHGIGMDPSDYTYSDTHRLFPWGKIKTIENFLIGMSIEIPQ
jgi:outer membrane protein assembly factor BamB